MRILVPIMLAVSIVASSAVGSARMPVVKQIAADHACCKKAAPDNDPSEQKGDCGTCLMTCCRIAFAPAEPVGDLLPRADLATDLFLPPLVAHDLSEPRSIFHPPRA
jgi:hypothetical protein